MIVKDEKDVIARCLNSVKDLIDYWVIVDTGSTDGTQKIIQKTLIDVPGRLYERPWVSFAHNRNEAMQYAMDKCDYLLLIDADEELVFTKDLDKSSLEEDLYYATVVQENMSASRPLLLKSSYDWYWQGVLHEELKNRKRLTHGFLEGVQNLANRKDGNRSKNPQKYEKDAETLRKALQKEPDNTRYLFYLAQTYNNLKDHKKALEHFEKRMQVGDVGNPEHFWATYVRGVIQQKLQYPDLVIEKSLYEACELYPNRIEPYYRLASHYYDRGLYLLSYAVSRHALTIKHAKLVSFTQHGIIQYGIYHVFGNSALQIHRLHEAEQAYTHIIQQKNVKHSIYFDTLCNLELVRTKLEEVKVVQ